MSTFAQVLQGETVRGEDLATSAEAVLAALAGCPQTPEYHGEGDVAVHTAMTLERVEELIAADPSIAAAEAGWGAVLLRLGGLLHDVGKPAVTVEKAPGRWSSKGHEDAGAGMTALLFQQDPTLAGLPLGLLPAVDALVRHHMWTWGIDEVGTGTLLRASHLVDPRLQALVWQADSTGRVAADLPKLLDQVEYAALLVRDRQAWEPCSWGPLAVTGDLPAGVRREVFRSVVAGEVTDAGHAAALASAGIRRRRPRLTYTFGLPGLGKSTWCEQVWQPATDGVVLSAEGGRRRDRRAAGSAVRAALPDLLGRGVPVCVDATHLTRQARDRVLGVAQRYGADVHAVHLRGRVDLALDRQRTRPDRDSVPAAVVRRMATQLRWPTPDEYGTLTVVEPDGRWWRWCDRTRWLDVDAAVAADGGVSPAWSPVG